MKIKEVVSIKPVVTVIDFQSKDRTLIDGYVVMEQTAKFFSQILEGLTKQRDEETTRIDGSIVPNTVNRCHKLTGTYGVGKSYFVLILKRMLESLENQNELTKIKSKFDDFKSIPYHLDILNKEAKKYIVVDINGKNFSELDFKSVIETEVYKKLIERIGQEKINFEGFYKNTVNQLVKWKKENSSLYLEFNKKFLSMIDYDYDEMIDALMERDIKSKEKYLLVYKEIMGGYPAQEFETLKEFIVEADKNAIENGYNGIIIIFDEFSTYLLGRAEKGLLNIDLSSIDILSESTIPSQGYQIHFITTEHEDIERILSKNLDNLNTINKTAGRFKKYNLYFDKGVKLIESVIVKEPVKFAKIKSYNTNIFDRYEKVNGYAKLTEIYPINPFTLEYLIKISEKYAQGDRTLFSFVDDDLRKFVENNDIYLKNQELNLLDIDSVMDCFGKVILKDREEFSKAYNIQIERAKTLLQKKIVKALALDYAVTITDSGKIKSGINDENIRYILSLSEDEYKDAKDYLFKEQNDSNSFIIYNDGTNGYELSPDSHGISIEHEVSKELNNTNENRLLESLIVNRSMTLDIRSTFIIPKASYGFPFDRIMEGAFIKGLGELEIINIKNELNKLSNDGKIFFYIPRAGQPYDYEGILKAAKEKAKEFVDNRIAFAIPKKFSFASGDVEILKRYEALERLTANETIMNNLKAQNSIRLEIVRLRNQIYNKLSSFGRSENFVFIFKYQEINYVKNMHEMIITWLKEKLYDKFPYMEVEDLSSRTASNLIITNLVVPRKVEKIDLNGSTVLAKQIRSSLQPLGLVNITKMVEGHRVEIKAPSKESKACEIFSIFETKDSELSLLEKYKKLNYVPYGINEPIFEMLLSIFLQTSDKYYLVNNEGKRIEVTQQNINSVWNKDYRLMETSDSVDTNIKRDVINVLELIDKNYLCAGTYQKLTHTMPSDVFGDFENSDIIIRYITSLAQKLEVFKGELEFLGIGIVTIEEIDNIIKFLTQTKTMYNPSDLLNHVSNIIDIYFYNEISLPHDGLIEIARYNKLQNIMDNAKWINEYKRSIKNYKLILNKIRKTTLNSNFENLKEKYNNCNNILNRLFNESLILGNWKNNKYQNTIDLKSIGRLINELIIEYNNKYKDSHGFLNIRKNELVDMVEENYYRTTLNTLEQIKFRGLEKLSSMDAVLSNINICQQVFSTIADTDDNGIMDIWNCDNCGTLDELISKIDKSDNDMKVFASKIQGIISSYNACIEELVNIDVIKDKYGKHETIINYTSRLYPEKVEDIRKLIGYIRDDWESSELLYRNLINSLYPIINEFIKSETIIVKKTVNYMDIVERINNKMRISGFKNMSIKQFEDQIIKEIKNIKNEFDEISINID